MNPPPTNRTESPGAATLARLTEYLIATGWHRQETIWRGATVWTHTAGQVVSVPQTVEHDIELRALDTVEGIARAEGRSPEAVAAELGVETKV
jgi:hypothetical protein